MLVFNGEIYNYREIARTLAVPADSDTHVLYELLAQGRMDLLSALRGMYAFVYWHPASGRLYAARDPFGIKPLFRLEHPNGEISFASTVSALAQHPDVSGPNPAALAHFLATGYIPEGVSAFARISKLESGVVQSWLRGAGGWERAADIAVALEGWRQMSPADAVEDAVLAHLVSDVEVGVMLSGGVDSTLVAAIASAQVDDLRTYSLVNPANPGIDEGSIAAWNAALLGTRHTEVIATPELLTRQLAPLVRSTGEPFGDAAYLPLSLLTSRIREDVKVALAGEGADELFGGYRRYDVERIGLHRVAGPAVRLAAAAAGRVTVGRLARESHTARTIESLGVQPGYRSHGHLMFFDWDVVLSAFPGVGGEALDLARQDWHDCLDSQWALGLARNRAFDLRAWLPNVFLEKSDRASMLHSVEVRTPYLDPVVATSTLGLRVKDTAKWPLRNELLRRVPEVRLPKRKKGLSVDFRGLLSAGLGQLSMDILRDPESLLADMGVEDASGVLMARAQASTVFSFRLAAMQAWSREWG